MSDEIAPSVTQKEFGRLVGVGQSVVSDYLSRGLVVADAKGRIDVRASLPVLFSHLREVAAGRRSDTGENVLDLTAERARLAKEQADKTHMENELRRRELLPRAMVVAVIQAMFSRVRARLLAIPTKAAPLLFGLSSPAEIKAALDEAVNEALRELSEEGAVEDAGASEAV